MSHVIAEACVPERLEAVAVSASAGWVEASAEITAPFQIQHESDSLAALGIAERG